ncbi:ABC-type multidrug transport system ATPase subunit [Bacillus mesophilus]|uniref:ABC transporter ATP-binding protein n=1 Tax=Bacillus mesophilus TaxID=1808955 RepID=A0A6M0Q424_9BACI|nr:ABC transporter ATP-binding protein [Bacillus mesophilus]MBM7660267.1 ABC-type multidrug transport system ATPase subunit [Bacillus mesophilus]NEY70982.1 ABC transporter ATP-binding protein [Bacillus mesophilus]
MNLTIDAVSKRFGNKLALDEVTLELTTGVYGILGSNGSGKTTLMRILASVMKPSSGAVYLDGKDIVKMDHQYRELIGYLPQHVGLYENFTAEKLLQYIAALKGLSKEKTNEKVEEVLTLVGLFEERKKKVGKFSGGMKRRVGIAQALLNDPKILIVDEPTAGLDPKERIRFRNLLSTISKDRIVLLSTHIVSDIEFIAKEILVLKQGKVISQEAPQTLLKGIEDKVWSVIVNEEEIPHYQEHFKVGNINRVENRVQLRMLSDTKPNEEAKKEVPNLEDLYLYYFDEEQL